MPTGFVTKPAPVDTKPTPLDTRLSRAGASEAELEEVRAVFRRAESAVEAWSLLAQQAGQRSAVQSDFAKLAFLEHPETDTQAAVWRANVGRRIVVAFRGTEQVNLLVSSLGWGRRAERVGVLSRKGRTAHELLVIW